MTDIRRHAAFDSRFPPDEETFAGRVMLTVASGTDDREGLGQWLVDLTELDEFDEEFPDQPVLDLDQARAVLEEVIAEHDRVVTETSADARAFAGAIASLIEAGVAFSFGDGWDKGEAAALAHEMAEDLPGAIGYVYSTTQDLERATLSGSSMSASPISVTTQRRSPG